MNRNQQQEKASNYSLLHNVAAPSPRYLMRLALLENLLRLLPTVPTSFLEIGPGMGDVSSYIVQRYPDINGKIIDISEHSVDIVRQRLLANRNLKFSCADFTELLELEHYDLVVACEVFEHLKDDEIAFDAVHRLLKSGAHFLFSVPAFMNKWGPADEYGGHVRRYEKPALQRQFLEHGFSIEKFWCYGFPVTNLISPVSKLYYRRVQSKSPLNQHSATKRSGTERSVAKRFRHLPFVSLMWPFFQIQNAFKQHNVGDGYIVLARKL